MYYDDANANGDDGNAKYVNTDDQVKYNYAAHDDDFYNFNDDGNRRRLRKLDTLDASHSLTAVETRKVRRRYSLFGCLFVFDSYSISYHVTHSQSNINTTHYRTMKPTFNKSWLSFSVTSMPLQPMIK